jgi:sucrose phosphorylase
MARDSPPQRRHRARHARRDRRGGRGRGRSEEIEALVETIDLRSRGESRRASGGAAQNVDSSQINCTFYDALGGSDREYLIARAIQCFVPGIPQIYYVGLLAGGNDLDLLRRTGVGRDINRHYYAAGEVQQQVRRPVVQALLSLLRIRNTHSAFGGSFRFAASSAERLTLEWTNGAEFARLDVSLTEMCASVTCSAAEAGTEGAVAWHSAVEAQA